MKKRILRQTLIDYYRHPRKFLILFLFIIIELISYPLLMHTAMSGIVFNITSTLVLVAAITAVGYTKTTFRLALILGGFAFLGIWYLLVFEGSAWSGIVGKAAYISRALFEFMVLILILKKIMKVKEITLDTIFGAVNVYLLMGMSFAMIYGLIVSIDPGAIVYGGHGIESEANPLFSLMYYSFVTLTTLGYGDILPISPMAKTVAYLEAVFGVMYMAILVASLVSIYISKGISRSSNNDN